VQHILTTTFGVFLMPCVFLTLPGKEKQQTCATHSYNTLWCVFNAICLPCSA
jgi:predicted metalloprotease with PDZ domain